MHRPTSAYRSVASSVRPTLSSSRPMTCTSGEVRVQAVYDTRYKRFGSLPPAARVARFDVALYPSGRNVTIRVAVSAKLLLRFPQLEPVPLGVHGPAEAAVVGVVDLLVNRDARRAELGQHGALRRCRSYFRTIVLRS